MSPEEMGRIGAIPIVFNPNYKSCYLLNCSALIWRRLMGRKALFTSFSGTKKIRSYTHCARQSVSLVSIQLTQVALFSMNSDITLTFYHAERAHSFTDEP